MLARFSIIVANTEHRIDTTQGEVLDLLDYASELKDPADEFQRTSTESFAQAMARISEGAYDIRDTYGEAGDFVSRYVTDDCPGSMRGTGEGGAWGVLMWLMGERSCPNPNFVHLAEDEVIATQLKLGSWRPPAEAAQ